VPAATICVWYTQVPVIGSVPFWLAYEKTAFPAAV
jgi:hypothetical protein